MTHACEPNQILTATVATAWVEFTGRVAKPFSMHTGPAQQTGEHRAENPAENQLNRRRLRSQQLRGRFEKLTPSNRSTGGEHASGHTGESPQRAPTVTTGSRKRTRCTTQTSTAQKQLNICDGDTDHREQVAAPHEHQQHSSDKSARGVADCKGQDTKITNRPRPKGSRLGTSRE